MARHVLVPLAVAGVASVAPIKVVRRDATGRPSQTRRNATRRDSATGGDRRISGVIFGQRHPQRFDFQKATFTSGDRAGNVLRGPSLFMANRGHSADIERQSLHMP